MKQQKQNQPLACEGLPITLAGRPWVMPSLNAAAAQRHWERIQAMDAATERDPIGLTVALVGECLRRNYPSLTDEWVAEHVDMDNWEALSAAVFGRGAFRRWADQQRAHQAHTEGNAVAPQPGGWIPGTGAPSMPVSPPPPAGPSTTSIG